MLKRLASIAKTRPFFNFCSQEPLVEIDIDNLDDMVKKPPQ